MACTIANGRAEPCKDIAGGIKNIYFINHVNGLEASATFDGDNQITAFASLLTLYKWECFGAETDSFDEAGNTSRDNGTSFFETTGTVVVRKQSVSDRKNLQLIQQGRPHIVTEDYNGLYKIYGLENGCDVSVTSQSGAAFGDLNGYTLSITAKETELANFITSSIIDDAVNTSVTTS